MSFPAWHVLTAAQNAADEALLTVGFGDGGGGGTTVGLLTVGLGTTVTQVSSSLTPELTPVTLSMRTRLPKTCLASAFAPISPVYMKVKVASTDQGCGSTGGGGGGDRGGGGGGGDGFGGGEGGGDGSGEGGGGDKGGGGGSDGGGGGGKGGGGGDMQMHFLSEEHQPVLPTFERKRW